MSTANEFSFGACFIPSYIGTKTFSGYLKFRPETVKGNHPSIKIYTSKSGASVACGRGKIFRYRVFSVKNSVIAKSRYKIDHFQTKSYIISNFIIGYRGNFDNEGVIW